MSDYHDSSEFYRSTANRIYALTFLLVGEGGEDLAAEALARALANWSTVIDTKRPEAWVRKVAVNLSISFLRRRRRERAFIEPRRVSESPSQGAEEDRLTIQQALERLSPKQRAAVVLRYYEDLSLKEMARVMRCTTSSADTHLRRGLERLRVTLAPDYDRRSISASQAIRR